MHMTGTDTVAGVVLAAGRSARMGRTKALLPVGGETFVQRVARTLADAGASPVLVVVAADTAAEIGRSIDCDARIVVNPRPDRGQLSSLQEGLSAVPESAKAVLITPVDLPLVRRATIELLLQTWRAREASVVRPVRTGRHGHPVLVARGVIEALRAAGADATARTVMQAFAADTVDVPVEDEGAFVDIDTREEYLRVLDALEGEKGKRGKREK